MLHDLLPNIVAQSDTPVATYRQLLALPPFARRHAARVRQSLIVATVVHLYGVDMYRWDLNGKLHRENDLPTLIFTDGDLEWWTYNKHHCDSDRPAVDCARGNLGWYNHGKRHRDGGQPAVVCADGTQEWWVDGKLVRSEN